MKKLIQTGLLLWAILGLNQAQAAATDGVIVGATQLNLQGGSDSSAQWLAPDLLSYKVWVQVPQNGTATYALYRVYPKGRLASDTTCASTNKTYPLLS